MSNMVVATNVQSLNAHRAMKGVGTEQARSSARLSSGYRINSAADDAAGLAISEKMRAQIRGLDQASSNSQNAISLIQTAEGGMQEIDNMIQRIRELVVGASNDTNEHNVYGTGDRQKIQDEVDQLTQEIDSMAERTEFNKKKVINGDYANPQQAMEKLSATMNLATQEKVKSEVALQAAANVYGVATPPTQGQLNAKAQLTTLAQQAVSGGGSVASTTAGFAANTAAISAAGIIGGAKADYLNAAGLLNDLALVDAFKAKVASVYATITAASAGDTNFAAAIAAATNASTLSAALAANAPTGTASNATLSALAVTALANLFGNAGSVSAAVVALSAASATTTSFFAVHSTYTAADGTAQATVSLVNVNDQLNKLTQQLNKSANGGTKTEVDSLTKMIDGIAGATTNATDAYKASIDAFNVVLTNLGTGTPPGLGLDASLKAPTSGTGMGTINEAAVLRALSSAMHAVYDTAITANQVGPAASAMQAIDSATTLEALSTKLAGMALGTITALALATAVAILTAMYSTTASPSSVGTNMKLAAAKVASAEADYLKTASYTNAAGTKIVGAFNSKSGAQAALAKASTVNNVAAAAYDRALNTDKSLQSRIDGYQQKNAALRAQVDSLGDGYKGLYFQVGANANQSTEISINSVKTHQLGIGDGNGKSSINVLKGTGKEITTQLDILDEALSYVTTERSKLGAVQNRMEYTIKSLDISSENLSAAESRIRDTDMAKEMSKLTRLGVLQQASMSMLAQANQNPQQLLTLLR